MEPRRFIPPLETRPFGRWQLVVGKPIEFALPELFGFDYYSNQFLDLLTQLELKAVHVEDIPEDKLQRLLNWVEQLGLDMLEE